MGTGLLRRYFNHCSAATAQADPTRPVIPAQCRQQVQQLANQTASAMQNNPQPTAAAIPNPGTPTNSNTPGPIPMLGNSQDIANAIAGPPDNAPPTAAPANTSANALGSLSQSLMNMGKPGTTPGGSTQLGGPAPQPQGSPGPQMGGMGAGGAGGGAGNSTLASMLAPAFAASAGGSTPGPPLITPPITRFWQCFARDCEWHK